LTIAKIKNEWLLDLCRESIVVDGLKKSSYYSAISINEEAISLVAKFKEREENLVIIKENPYNATKLYEELSAYLEDENLVLYVPEESLRVEAIASSYENMGSRIDAMYGLLSESKKIIITSANAVTKYLPKVEVFQDFILNLKLDQEIGIASLKEKLFQAGYNQVSRVETPLTFAARGGIIDIYSINYSNPIRIEFFDTIIESIRFFDISSQRTIEKIEQVTVLPATDNLITTDEKQLIRESALKAVKNHEVREFIDLNLEYIENNVNQYHLYTYRTFLTSNVSILDYIRNPLIVLSTKDKIKDHLDLVSSETIAYVQEMVSLNKMLARFSLFFDFNSVISKYQVLENDTYSPVLRNILELSVPLGNTQYVLTLIQKDLKQYKIVCAIKENELTLLTNLLKNIDLEYNLISDLNDFKLSDKLNIVIAELSSGIELIDKKIHIYTSNELFKRLLRKGKYVNRYKESKILDSYQELTVGDFVVHNKYGIGKYLGIVTKEIKNSHNDYLRIIFAGNDELLVPLEQFSLVRKFVSKEGAAPKLHKIGSDKWAKTKEKLAKNIENIADGLVELYSLRQENIGFKFKKDSSEQIKFESDFEYELTEDQATSLIEIKEDMESDRPMDRLLCGDVGFGKTEVAAVAAFKAVDNNKQVAFLCPTTILSIQHYKTFVKRFRNFAVRIEVINRFVAQADQKKIIKDLKEGKIDILIGTHRLLSNDIVYQDIGLLIIDEEQRFGVKHKEKIKEFKQSVDVLSLSATPIPRTMQMSLVGIRQLSTLDTPPNNRYPVQTYVVEKSRGLVTEVVLRELQRKGQVFYLYNNVKEIYSQARLLQREIPSARIGVAHGQMTKNEIEDIMLGFNRGEFDVLVCTTIIETGIDIPNANTIIIDNAHTFGLSQLYQIKGRVGRSDRVAYAYLLLPEKRVVNEDAAKRLKAIKEFAQLGSGYKIAMRDLTIRGAGDLLGPNQSGFIDTVGIDMYMEMLEAAIKRRKGIKVEEKKVMKKSKIKIDGYIPHSYAPEDNEKIGLYKEIDKIDNLRDLDNYRDSVVDQYGKLPKNVALLFEKKQLDILINSNDISDLKEIKGKLYLIFSEELTGKFDGEKLFVEFTKINRNIKIRYTDMKITVEIPKTKDNIKTAIRLIEKSRSCLK